MTAPPEPWHLHPQLAEDTHPVASWPLCEVRLMDDANHPWLFSPHKLNVAALGNLVPQLHVHVIARFQDDIAWPRPVWGMAAAKPYPPEALVERIRALRTRIESESE